jgi:hypothetical protein
MVFRNDFLRFYFNSILNCPDIPSELPLLGALARGIPAGFSRQIDQLFLLFTAQCS